MNTTNSISIRRAQVEDSAQLVDLCRQLGYTVAQDRLEQRLKKISADPDHVAFVAVAEGAGVVGMLHASRVCIIEAEEFAEVTGVVVDQNRRSLGIGKTMIEAVEVWAREQGLHTVRLRSNVIRKDAHRFYQRLGYSIIKTQVALEKHL